MSLQKNEARIHFTLPAELSQQIRHDAEEGNRALSQQIRMIIRAYYAEQQNVC